MQFIKADSASERMLMMILLDGYETTELVRFCKISNGTVEPDSMMLSLLAKIVSYGAAKCKINKSEINSPLEITIDISRNGDNELYSKICVYKSAAPYRVSLKNSVIVYKFFDYFDIVDAVAALKNRGLSPICCKLYKMNNEYYGEFRLNPQKRRKCTAVLCEFGKKAKFRTENVLNEHAVLLSNDFLSDCEKIDKNHH